MHAQACSFTEAPVKCNQDGTPPRKQEQLWRRNYNLRDFRGSYILKVTQILFCKLVVGLKGSKALPVPSILRSFSK